MSEVLDRIARQRIVPVLRSASPDDAVATARACAGGGLTLVELTCSTPQVERALQALADDGLTLGLGTVTTTDEIRAAASAGARFVVSYAAPEGFVETARELGLVGIPGALTPTEILHAMQRGADAVKLFPGGAIGPGYLSDLRAVLPDVPILVTGGLSATADSLKPWFDAGAFAVGLGSALGSVAALGAAEVERRARSLVELAATGDAAP